MINRSTFFENFIQIFKLEAKKSDFHLHIQLKTICEFKTWILFVQNIEYFDISKQLNIFKLYNTL